ncbi:MAG: 3-phosphoshikimate 1-carboxyvinyltransferase [Oscillospiraceae bacterium]
MEAVIKPSKLSGKINAISSKSDAHRALICAALADSPTKVLVNSFSDDIEATVGALTALGAKIIRTEHGLTVMPTEHVEAEPQIDCRESGSTLRFLLPVAAAMCRKATVIGRGRLPQRPMSPLIDELALHGCDIGGKRLPMTVSGGLLPGKYEIGGDISSQFISGLLFALPMLCKDSEIVLTSPLQSSGYVNMTIKTLANFNIEIIETKTGFRVPGKQNYITCGEYKVEGDWSNSAFWLAAGALGNGCAVTGLCEKSLQKDKEIVEILTAQGAEVESGAEIISVRPGEPDCENSEIDAREIPDLVPIAAVLACKKKAKTVFTNCERLRLKESDRLEAVREMICALGGEARCSESTLTIVGSGSLRGGIVDSKNDHRIAMSAAIAAALCSENIIITGADAVKKSYPDFFCDYIKLGGEGDVVKFRK